MIYIPEIEQNKKCLHLIAEVLEAHAKMRAEKEQIIADFSNGNFIFKGSEVSLKESYKDLELIQSKIDAIKYTFDYVKLMLNH